jgi:hypothetical protein
MAASSEGLICCTVLLLDEADVFLEERTLQDLERNSLVSGKYSCPFKYYI